MSEFAGVIGYFVSAEDLRAAAARVRSEPDIHDVTAYLPLPDRSSLEAVEPGDSPVRFFSLAGGLTGIAIAVSGTVFCSWQYPLVVGGKSITSWPPFLVISFELMVLFGVLFSLAGFAFLSHLPHVIPEDGYDPRLAIDTFGLFIPCPPHGSYRAYAEQVLRDCSAEEVAPVYR